MREELPHRRVRQPYGSFGQFFNSGAWKKVLAALQQQLQGPVKKKFKKQKLLETAALLGLQVALMPAPGRWLLVESQVIDGFNPSNFRFAKYR